MRKFSQPVSMPCTEQQYKADLQQPLKEMGYYETEQTVFRVNEDYVDDTVILRGIRVVAIKGFKSDLNPQTHYIPTYNPKLFLAIAAMCSDDPVKVLPGRYFKCIHGYSTILRTFKKGKLSKGNSYKETHPKYWAPATLEDLVEAFGHVAEGKLKPLLHIDMETYVPQEKSGLEALMYMQEGVLIDFKATPMSMEEAEKKVAEWRKSNPEIIKVYKKAQAAMYKGATHKVTITPYMKDGRMQFDDIKTEPLKKEATKDFGTRVHEAAEEILRGANKKWKLADLETMDIYQQTANIMQEMLPKKVDNPLPGKNYFFQVMPDEFVEGTYIGKSDFHNTCIIERDGELNRVDALYEIPAKKEYSEENMEEAYAAGLQHGRSVAMESAQVGFKRWLKYKQDGKTN